MQGMYHRPKRPDEGSQPGMQSSRMRNASGYFFKRAKCIYSTSLRDSGTSRAMFPPMKDSKYQAVVIGGGSGGYAAAATLGKNGVRTALIDKSAELGGLCILRGCMPSKALIESANLLRKMRSAADFGIHIGELRVSMDEVQDRKQRLISGFQQYRIEQLKTGEFDLIRGEASFRDPNSLEVNVDGSSRIIGFEHAVIATGSVPRIPKIEGLADGPFWGSREALATREIPEHLLIVGGGAIGCEMAHCFEGLGSKVSVIQRSGCLLNDFEEDIGRLLTTISEKRGIEIYCNSHVKKVTWREGGGAILKINQGGIEKELTGSHVLVAIGRKPAIEKLRLDAAGIEVDGGRIPTDCHMRTNLAHIFAVGDTTNELPVVHEAVIQGEAVGKHVSILVGALDEELPSDDSLPHELFGIFTHPECARAGMSVKKIEMLGLATCCATYVFADHGKAEILGETEGFVKIVSVKGSGKILSASAIGPHVVDLIHELQVAIHAGLSVAEFAKIPHYHPTLAEIWTYPATELSGL